MLAIEFVRRSLLITEARGRGGRACVTLSPPLAGAGRRDDPLAGGRGQADAGRPIAQWRMTPPAPAPAPALIDTRGLAQALDRFARERDWEPFHSPKNLAMALAGETGELCALFQWLTEEQSRAQMLDAATAEPVRNEMADVLMYLVRLATVLGVDLDAAVRDKLALNALKYPSDKARGNSTKYDRL